MTKKHYYITTGTDWETTTKAFVVAIGTSQREQRVQAALTRYSVDAGDYFVLASVESSVFFMRVIETINDPVARGIRVTGAQMLRFLKHGELPPLTQESLDAAHRFRWFTDSDYRISCNLARKKA